MRGVNDANYDGTLVKVTHNFYILTSVVILYLDFACFLDVNEFSGTASWTAANIQIYHQIVDRSKVADRNNIYTTTNANGFFSIY